MLGHLRRITQIFDHRSEHGLLGLISRALGKEAPTASRRYDTIWEIDLLLSWLRQRWAENSALRDEELQTKAMLLVMIFSACRLAELARMERPNQTEGEQAALVLRTVTKQFQEAKRRIVIRKLSSPVLCPVAAVRAWMQRSPTGEQSKLFYGFRSDAEGRMLPTTMHPLSVNLICTQFLRAMQSAGIPSHFTAYSVKHAVVTRLFRMGATEEQVNAYGGWAQGSRTARRWYDIATLEQDWLGAKLVGEWFGADPTNTLEEFLHDYLPRTTTEKEAEARAAVMDALADPETPASVSAVASQGVKHP
jgi:integrase